jgi:hypothetical protein
MELDCAGGGGEVVIVGKATVKEERSGLDGVGVTTAVKDNAREMRMAANYE